jgi:hypothetical protein
MAKAGATGGLSELFGGGDRKPPTVKQKVAGMGAKQLGQRIEKRQAAGKPTGFAEKQLGNRMVGLNKAAGAKVGGLNQRIEKRMGAGKDVAGLQEKRGAVMGRVQNRMGALKTAGRTAGGRAFSRGLTRR